MRNKVIFPILLCFLFAFIVGQGAAQAIFNLVRQGSKLATLNKSSRAGALVKLATLSKIAEVAPRAGALVYQGSKPATLSNAAGVARIYDTRTLGVKKEIPIVELSEAIQTAKRTAEPSEVATQTPKEIKGAVPEGGRERNPVFAPSHNFKFLYFCIFYQTEQKTLPQRR